jgi:hypothetical protein
MKQLIDSVVTFVVGVFAVIFALGWVGFQIALTLGIFMLGLSVIVMFFQWLF